MSKSITWGGYFSNEREIMAMLGDGVVSDPYDTKPLLLLNNNIVVHQNDTITLNDDGSIKITKGMI